MMFTYFTGKQCVWLDYKRSMGFSMNWSDNLVLHTLSTKGGGEVVTISSLLVTQRPCQHHLTTDQSDQYSQTQQGLHVKGYECQLVHSLIHPYGLLRAWTIWTIPKMTGGHEFVHSLLYIDGMIYQKV